MATDWPAILPTLLADADAGLGVRAIAAKHGLPQGSVSRWLRKGKPETVKPKALVPLKPRVSPASEGLDTEGLEGDASSKAPLTAQLSQLEIDREAARRAMRQGLAGEIELSAQQTALIKLLLKDELEPETERNLYAGRPTDELGERALVLAVSVLGLVKVAAQLRELSKAGTLDLGLNWTPEDGDGATAHGTPTPDAPADTARSAEASEMREALEAVQPARPAETVTPAAAVSAGMGGVESVEG